MVLQRFLTTDANVRGLAISHVEPVIPASIWQFLWMVGTGSTWKVVVVESSRLGVHRVPRQGTHGRYRALAGQAVAFTYRRAPHLTPPHQIEGLVLEYERRLCEQLGLTCHKHVLPQRDMGRAALEAALARQRPILLVVEGQAVEAAWWQGVYAGTFYEIAWQPFQLDWATLLRQALVANAHEMLVCSGWWYGVDGIEFWSEDVVRWQDEPQWPQSAATMSRQIETEGALWRQTLAHALHEQTDTLAIPSRLISALDDVCTRWHQVGALLADAATAADVSALPSLSAPILRLAHTESRFWSRIIDTFGTGI